MAMSTTTSMRRALTAVTSRRASLVGTRNSIPVLVRNAARHCHSKKVLMPCQALTTQRSFVSTTTPLFSLAKYYKIEVSNVARPDATKITVRGPDVDGILASMTVALAQHGCSLKELHAGYMAETVSFEKHVEGDQIEDVFFVSKHDTGEPFLDDDLESLGESLLRSLENPMTTLSGKSVDPAKFGKEKECFEETQITVLKKGNL